jgi:hypothetical protein
MPSTSAALTAPVRTTPFAVIKKMQGLIGGTTALGLGIVRAIVDAAGNPPSGEDPPYIGLSLILAFGVAYVATYFPLMIPNSAPSDLQWAAWGLSLSLALAGALSFIKLADEAAKKVFRVALPFLRAGLATARFIVFVVDFAKTPTRNAVTDVQFARNLFLGLPPGFNWLRLERLPPLIWLLAGIDVGSGVVVCALDITAGFLDTDSVAGTGVSVQHG